MFLIEKDSEMTLLQLGQIIQKFQTKELLQLNKYWNYFKGNQKIKKKEASDIGKPCNKVTCNYCFNIVQNYRGYLTGLDIAYNAEQDFSSIQEVLDYNDVHTEDSEFLKDALIFGVAYEIAYLDEDGKHRFKKLDPRTVIPVYDNTLDQNLMYAIRLYKNDMVGNDEYIVEVYSDKDIKIYRSQMGFSSFSLLEEKPHYFSMVPITVFELNYEQESIFNQIISLQDAYNELLSDEVDDFQAFADAYLVLKGVTADSDDLAAMKENRVLMMDSDSDAGYLTKNITDTQIENMLKNINEAIHKIANSPDFSDEKLMAQSGIAMRYKLVGFENVSSAIEANMKKALQRRIELICAILNLKGGDSIWRDVKIQFTRNLPTNTEEVCNMVNTLRGLVSDKTLLSLLPFISDPEAELEQLKEERETNASMYSFISGKQEEEEVNE